MKKTSQWGFESRAARKKREHAERQALTPLVRLPLVLLQYIVSFLGRGWLVKFQFSRLSKHLLPTCPPFRLELAQFIRNQTDLKMENVDMAIAAGACLSGSTIHAVLYGESYYQDVSCRHRNYSTRHQPSNRETVLSDLDFYYVCQRPYQYKELERFGTMLVPDEKEWLTLDDMQSDDLRSEDEHYANILPLINQKFRVVQAGKVPKWEEKTVDFHDRAEWLKQQDGLAKHRQNLAAAKTRTIIELIGIKHEKSVPDFLEKFVDISIGMVYFDGKLHWRNLDHLIERKFSVRWDLERYMKKRSRYHYTSKMREVDEQLIVRMADRLYQRATKYERRGFECLNLMDDYDVEYHAENEITRLLPSSATAR